MSKKSEDDLLQFKVFLHCDAILGAEISVLKVTEKDEIYVAAAHFVRSFFNRKVLALNSVIHYSSALIGELKRWEKWKERIKIIQAPQATCAVDLLYLNEFKDALLSIWLDGKAPGLKCGSKAALKTGVEKLREADVLFGATSSLDGINEEMNVVESYISRREAKLPTIGITTSMLEIDDVVREGRGFRLMRGKWAGHFLMLKKKACGRQTSLMLFKRAENLFFVSAMTFMQFALGLAPLHHMKTIQSIMEGIFPFGYLKEERFAIFNLADLDDILTKLQLKMEEFPLYLDEDCPMLADKGRVTDHRDKIGDSVSEIQASSFTSNGDKNLYFGRVRDDGLLELSRHSRFVTIACFEKDGDLRTRKADFFSFINKEASCSTELTKEILRSICDDSVGADDSISVKRMHDCLKDIVRNTLKEQPHKLRHKAKEQIRLFREKARRLDEHWNSLETASVSNSASIHQKDQVWTLDGESNSDKILICLPFRRRIMMDESFNAFCSQTSKNITGRKNSGANEEVASGCGDKKLPSAEDDNLVHHTVVGSMETSANETETSTSTPSVGCPAEQNANNLRDGEMTIEKIFFKEGERHILYYCKEFFDKIRKADGMEVHIYLDLPETLEKGESKVVKCIQIDDHLFALSKSFLHVISGQVQWNCSQIEKYLCKIESRQVMQFGRQKVDVIAIEKLHEALQDLICDGVANNHFFQRVILLNNHWISLHLLHKEMLCDLSVALDDDALDHSNLQHEDILDCDPVPLVLTDPGNTESTLIEVRNASSAQQEHTSSDMEDDVDMTRTTVHVEMNSEHAGEWAGNSQTCSQTKIAFSGRAECHRADLCSQDTSRRVPPSHASDYLSRDGQESAGHRREVPICNPACQRRKERDVKTSTEITASVQSMRNLQRCFSKHVKAIKTLRKDLKKHLLSLKAAQANTMGQELSIASPAAVQECGTLNSNLPKLVQCVEDDMMIKFKSELLARKQVEKSLEKVYQDLTLRDVLYDDSNSSKVNSRDAPTVATHPALQEDNHHHSKCDDPAARSEQAETCHHHGPCSMGYQSSPTSCLPRATAASNDGREGAVEFDKNSDTREPTKGNSINCSEGDNRENSDHDVSLSHEATQNNEASHNGEDSATSHEIPARPDDQSETDDVVFALRSLFERINENGDKTSRINGAEVVQLLHELKNRREEHEQAKIILSGLQSAHRLTKEKTTLLPEATQTFKETFGSFEVGFKALDLLQDRKKWGKAKLFMCRDLELVFMLDKRVDPAKQAGSLKEQWCKDADKHVRGVLTYPAPAPSDPPCETLATGPRPDVPAEAAEAVASRKRKREQGSEQSQRRQGKVQSAAAGTCKFDRREKEFVLDAEIYVNEEDDISPPKKYEFMERWWGQRRDYRSKDIAVGMLVCVLFEEREDDSEEIAKKRKKAKFLLVARKHHRWHQEI